jgi:hypothetical protein
MKHQRSESLRKLQRLQKGLPEDDEELSAIFTIRKCPSADTGKTQRIYSPLYFTMGYRHTHQLLAVPVAAS